jgi:pimeloyl-ACP methyl ester carboxylesterase
MAKTFLLIHGAWHAGWGWSAVASHLRAAGHKVYAPTLPGLNGSDDPKGRHLSDCIDYLVDFVTKNKLKDVTMVAHSWGGYPMTGAAAKLKAHVSKLVYWSAFVPAVGKSLLDEVPADYVRLFNMLSEASGNATVAMPLEVFQGGFMGDASADASSIIHSLLRPQPMSYFNEAIDVDVTKIDIAKAYILASEDVAMPPGEYSWLNKFPHRLGIKSPIMTAGSHEALFTRPKELAEAILKA